MVVGTMHKYTTKTRRTCECDKHGVARLRAPLEEIEAGMLRECPICDGSGRWPGQYGWEYCPVANQIPQLHRRAI